MNALILHIIIATVALIVLDHWRRQIVRDRNILRAAELFDKTDGRVLRAVRQGYERMVDFKGSQSVDKMGDVETKLLPYVEYAGKRPPVVRVFVGKTYPTVATLVLKADLADLKPNGSGIDGFDVVFRPFAKPVCFLGLDEGHFRLWLPTSLSVDKREDGKGGSNG